MEIAELLRRAAELVPADARSDAGLSMEDVRECLSHDEWEMALGVLQDFDGIEWQSVEYWNLLADAARQMWLTRDAAWCHWRGSETHSGILIRAGLQLTTPEAGGRRRSVPGAGQLRPMWAIGCPQLSPGLADLYVARIWVESASEIPPGGRGPIRLLLLTPSNWRHLAVGDVITMHEQQPISGTATITEIRRHRTTAPAFWDTAPGTWRSAGRTPRVR
ncbi:hypothetical protein [Nonomuraea gerenzanensis]|uniref:hypothetical protein n=1 Tax=Nonomuraea gerenzanensis TaxID=93944 RepID=UPI001CD9E8FA|nr:hypothetical protein [Nonomuraea gerenzanensis]UBU08405.1 hypothetical protein LCN96_28845 [Nonomuraea gerenzanensis]